MNKILIEPWTADDLAAWVFPLKPEDAHEFACSAIGALHAAHEVIDSMLTTGGCEYNRLANYADSLKHVLEYAGLDELLAGRALDVLANSDWPMDRSNP